MDKLTRYRDIIRDIIRERANVKFSRGDIRAVPSIDPIGDHYQLFHVGWDEHRRIHGCVLHVDIIENKFWIQYDGTSAPVAEELLEAGVPADDIVLAFQPVELRPYTDFAVA